MPNTLDVTGATLIYDEFGDGPDTIVFVHDAGGNHLSWWNQIPQFQDRLRCVIYEVRGWGQSQDLSNIGSAPRSVKAVFHVSMALSRAGPRLQFAVQTRVSTPLITLGLGLMMFHSSGSVSPSL